MGVENQRPDAEASERGNQATTDRRKDAVTWRPQTARLRMHADTGQFLGRKTSCNRRNTCAVNGHFVPHLPTRGFHRRAMTTYGRSLGSSPSAVVLLQMEAHWRSCFALLDALRRQHRANALSNRTLAHHQAL